MTPQLPEPTTLIETDPCVVERPGMAPYRAKKAPTAQYWGDDDPPYRYGVTVLRTHDVGRARRLAAGCFRWINGEVPDPFPEPSVEWLRLVPWGGDGGSYEHAKAGDRGAIPCVVFEVNE
jgi:hypothetical protein